jgi:drug/metabolite transporter (DMT)-like permease
VGRTVVSYSGMLCWFYALANMPLADATSLMFTLPLFTVLLARMFLGEHVGLDRWAATAIGFCGALIIIRPGFATVGLAAGAALYTALSYAGANAMTKSLVRTEDSNVVVFYNFALLGVIAVGPAIHAWQTPAWSDVSWILVFGVLSLVAQQCITRSFAAAPASVVTPFQFLKLPFVALIALMWFAEEPDPWTWLGALVIFASAYVIVRREARPADNPGNAP